MSRHNPPNSSTCVSGSLNVPRLVYCSGRLSASTAAAAGATSARPQARQAAEQSTAHPPISGVITSAAGIPPSQTDAAMTSGIPPMNGGSEAPLR